MCYIVVTKICPLSVKACARVTLTDKIQTRVSQVLPSPLRSSLNRPLVKN